jgi:hypothetical protein
MTPNRKVSAVVSVLAVGLITCWIAGGSLRYLDVSQWRSRGAEWMRQIPGMILFAPAITACLFAAWRCRPAASELLSAGIVFVLSMIVWNGIMLWQYWHREVLLSNLIHWLIFMTVSIVAAKYWQWTTGIAILETRESQARGAINGVARLTIRKLLLLVFIIALLIAVYANTTLPYRRSYPESLPVYKLFLFDHQPLVSALIGGLIYPIHWLVVSMALRFGSWRTAIIVGWIPMVMLIRWITGEIYFFDLRYPSIGTDALDSLSDVEHAQFNLKSIGWLNWPQPTNLSTDTQSQSAGILAIEAITQSALTLFGLWIIRRLGYRAGFSQ